MYIVRGVGDNDEALNRGLDIMALRVYHVRFTRFERLLTLNLSTLDKG